MPLQSLSPPVSAAAFSQAEKLYRLAHLNYAIARARASSQGLTAPGARTGAAKEAVMNVRALFAGVFAVALLALGITTPLAAQSSLESPSLYAVQTWFTLGIPGEGIARVMGPLSESQCSHAIERQSQTDYSDTIPPNMQREIHQCLNKTQLPMALYNCAMQANASIPKHVGMHLWLYSCVRL